MCLRRYVIMVVALLPALMDRNGRRYVRAWHHCRRASKLPLQSAPVDKGPSDRPARQLRVSKLFQDAMLQ